MPDSNDVILRYFRCRGRAQALRDALADAGVAYTDLQVSDWGTREKTRDFAGLFASLPTLHWGGIDACETLPIARLLTDKLGHRRGMSEQRAADLEAVCSAMLMDVIVPVAQAVWADLLFPGAEIRHVVTRRLPHWLGKLSRGAALLSAETPFLEGAAPVVADFFLFEAFDAVGALVGPAHVERLERALPRLARLQRDLLSRPRMTQVYATRPDRLTGRPDEAAVVAHVHSCDPTEVWPS